MSTKLLTKDEYLERYKQIAREHGGVCMSEEYIYSGTELHFRCKEGHDWWARPSNIKQGQWCKICAYDKRRTGIEKYQEYAELKGGVCLSASYTNCSTKIQFQCKRKHKWWAIPNSIRDGKWCRKCVTYTYSEKHKNKSYEKVKHILTTRGCVLITTRAEYNGAHHPLSAICERGHNMAPLPKSIFKYGKWCKTCANQGIAKSKTPDSYKKVMETITEKGGYLHTPFEDYTNTHRKIKVTCENGHIFAPTGITIIRNHWCPDCKFTKSRGEIKCTETFEKLFRKPFPKKHPEWLKSPKSNRQLELDGFNSDLAIAFEYQGEQHYYPISHFKGATEYKRIIERDEWKRTTCKQKGITLIEVPYTVKLNDIENFIISECNNLGIEIEAIA